MRAPDSGIASFAIRLFGPFDVQLDGEALPSLRSRKGEWLLALLVLRHGHDVERSWLAGLLWPDSPEPQALANLRNCLTDLRRALGPQADRLRSPTSRTLTFDLIGTAADVVAFDASVTDGGAAALEQAVALYRGPLLEGCSEEWAFQEREARQEAYRQARERLAALAPGRAHPIAGDEGAREGGSEGVPRTNPVPSLPPSLAPSLPATLTFLFTDIAGSTRLWEEHPDVMGLALERHDAFLRDAIRTNQGRIFKTLGDAFCAAFEAPAGAVAAALTAQRALRGSQNSAVAPVAGLAMQVRMALHTGVAEQRDGDYFGPALNRVTRLLEVCHGGQILLSGVARELAQDDLPAGAVLVDLGMHRLRDLQRSERVFQLRHLELPAEFPPLASLDTLPNNLPQQVTSFIGREREIADVRQLLEATRLLTLTGAGGTGKTRLALQVAAQLLAGERDGVWLVEFAPLADPALVAQTAATVLGVREEVGKPLLQTLVSALKEKRLLLLLDNCEHVLDACAVLTEALLRDCAGVRVLATSRQGLGLSGEQIYVVPSLSVPDPRHLPSTPAELVQYDAVRLFIDRATQCQPSFRLTAENAPALPQICHRLDGIPLAIELAAARVKALPVQQIVHRLDDVFRLLKGGSRTALPRHQTLRALIDWSYDLLTREEQALLRRLSAFAGGWTLDAVEAVCSDFGFAILDFGLGEGGVAGPDAAAPSAIQNPKSKIQNPDVLDLLASLVEKSLVQYEEEGEGRYRLLETVRQYGRDRLWEAGEVDDVRCRHRDFFLDLAERGAPALDGPEQPGWLLRLEVEHDNLRSALEWCRERLTVDSGRLSIMAAAPPSARAMDHRQQATDGEAGLRLAGALTRFWQIRSYWNEGREWLGEVLARTAGLPPTAARGKALDGAGSLAWEQGDAAAAWSLHAESLAIRRGLGDRAGIAASLYGLGRVAFVQSDFRAAQSHFAESLAIRRELGAPQETATSLVALGNTAVVLGDYVIARAHHEESLAIQRRVGDQDGISGSLLALGNVALDQGDVATAQAHYTESLAIRRELGGQGAISYGIMALGNVALSGRLYSSTLLLRREPGSAARDRPEASHRQLAQSAGEGGALSVRRCGGAGALPGRPRALAGDRRQTAPCGMPGGIGRSGRRGRPAGAGSAAVRCGRGTAR